MIHIFVMALAVLFCAYFNGIMDSIMFYRTHLGQHPYRDYWHLCKYITRICLIVLGVGTVLAIQTVGWYTLCIIILLPKAYHVWKRNAYTHDKYYKVDETLRISTSIAWLDKILGFHH
jgi:hypothetical protein